MSRTSSSRMERISEVLRLGFLIAIVAGQLIARVTACFDRHKDIALCMRRNNISIPILSGPSGFDFGWGSVDETEEMCRTRGHILTLSCMKTLVNQRCVGSTSFTLKRLLLDAVFDVAPYIRAADYMCHEQNLRIFTENRKCLKRQEASAENCSRRKALSMEDAMRDLKNKAQTGSAPSNAVKYKNFVYKIMHQHQCSGQVGSMKCIFYYINRQCDRRIVLLLMNYYKELLPDDCKLNFDYESELNSIYEPRSDQARPRSNISRVYEVRSHPEISSGFVRPSLAVIVTSLLVWNVGVVP